jgi:hypothetical protein
MMSRPRMPYTLLRQKCGLEMEVFMSGSITFRLVRAKATNWIQPAKPNAKSPIPRNPFPPLFHLWPLATCRFRNNTPLLPGQRGPREASQNRRPEDEALHTTWSPSIVSSFEHGFGRYPGYKVKLHVYGWSPRGWGCRAQII